VNSAQHSVAVSFARFAGSVLERGVDEGYRPRVVSECGVRVSVSELVSSVVCETARLVSPLMHKVAKTVT